MSSPPLHGDYHTTRRLSPCVAPGRHPVARRGLPTPMPLRLSRCASRATTSVAAAPTTEVKGGSRAQAALQCRPWATISVPRRPRRGWQQGTAPCECPDYSGQVLGGSALAVAGLTARSLVTTRGPRVCTTRVCVRRDRPGGGTKGKPKGLPTVPRTN